MENRKHGCSSQLKTKLCFIAIVFALIFAAISILLWMRFKSSVSGSTPISSSSSSPAQKYPFFPHSGEDERRIRKMVDEINARDLPWKAEYNALASLEGPVETSIRDLASLKLDGFDIPTSVNKQIIGDTEARLKELATMTETIPQSFDAREQWPRCASIHHIQNQGGCGSCWAAASVGVMSDRLCISSNSTEQEMVSMQDLVSCCEFCGQCTGAHIPILPFLYWKTNGIVTGGSFGSNEGCKPYEIESSCGVPCPVHFYSSSSNPQCNRTCSKLYEKEYTDDLRKGQSIYWIKMSVWYYDDDDTGQAYDEIERIYQNFSSNISANDLIKREIMTNGPVAFSTLIEEPFAHYRSGVYTNSHVEGHLNLRYGHAMRIIGWGEENGEEYWTIANSWGRQWGENGFGRLSVNYMPDILSVYGGVW